MAFRAGCSFHCRDKRRFSIQGRVYGQKIVEMRLRRRKQQRAPRLHFTDREYHDGRNGDLDASENVLAMPIPSPVTSDREFPSKVDVAIIGGGIAGISVALELAERGIQTAVFEKGIIAGEQSSANWGWCRQMGRDPRELPLAKISLNLWRNMNKRVEGETGFQQSGIAYLCDSEEQLQAREAWVEAHGKDHDLNSTIISSSEANALSPKSAMAWKGGLYTPDDGRAEPTLAVPAMARAYQKCGGRIFQNCAVRSFEKEGGQVSALITEQGRVRTSTLVLAGGAWSRRFCDNMGIRLPQLTVINSAMRLATLETSLTTSLAGKKFAIRKRFDGGYTLAHFVYNTADIVPDSFRLLREFAPLLKDEWRDFTFRLGRRFVDEARLKRRWRADEQSPFEKVRILNAKPVDRLQNEALASLKKTFPEFESAEVAETWAGVIDVLPDAVPIISAVNSEPGLYLSTGYSGHGFGLGPGAGRLMAEIITGEETCINAEPFRYDRFISTRDRVA